MAICTDGKGGGIGIIMNNWKQHYHIEPEAGWLNDPNGLCFFKGYYHVFYQYSFEPEGGNKYWAHLKSKDLIHWEKAPLFLSPDREFDKNGVYSGSTYIKDDTMHIFYTGNVKEKGDFDYIYKGRSQNIIHVTSKDGEKTDSRGVLMYNKDYPEGLSCHVRDPKVFEYEGKYYMVLGARTMDDRGEALVFESENLENWKHIRTFETMAKFGYMWECPDLFEINGQWILMACPQGLERGKYEYQNIYSSGYFIIEGDFRTNGYITDYKESDFGFDFYAPQTFTHKGRRLLLGWMGMPDAKYTNPTVKFGYQHCMTIFRELDFKDNTLYMNPAYELESLRKFKCDISSGEKTYNISKDERAFDLELEKIGDKLNIKIFDTVELDFDAVRGDLKLSFTANGYGRDNRYLRLKKLDSLRTLIDSSSVEIFINAGKYVMSARMYPASYETIEVSGAAGKFYSINV